jgi:hypothetical protein
MFKFAFYFARRTITGAVRRMPITWAALFSHPVRPKDIRVGLVASHLLLLGFSFRVTASVFNSIFIMIYSIGFRAWYLGVGDISSPFRHGLTPSRCTRELLP